MTYDVEDRLKATLRRRAEDEVDADRLLRAALARARARRHRRRVASAFGGAGVAGVTAAVLTAPLTLAPGGSGSADPWPSRSVLPPIPASDRPLPRDGAYPVPQLGRDGPGAEARPDLVGTDPLGIHFGIADMPLPVLGAAWGSGGGVETVQIAMGPSSGDPTVVTVEVARGRFPLPNPTGPDAVPPVSGPAGRVGGRPATGEEYEAAGMLLRAVRWSPVDGVEARVWSYHLSIQNLLRMAGLVRPDRAVGCAAPVRVTALPPGARLTACAVAIPLAGAAGGAALHWPRVDIDSGARLVERLSSEDAMLRFEGGPGSAITVGVGVPRPGASPWPLPGVKAIPDLDGRWVAVGGVGAYRDGAVGSVLAGLRAAGDPARPETWPPNPVG